MSTSNHGRHWDSLTSEKLLKEIQRIPIQRGDGKGSFANRSKTLQGSNYANCIFFLVKTCFLNLASLSVHSVLPPKGVHIAKVSPFQSKFRPFIRNHGTTMIPPRPLRRVETQHSAFFLSCRLSRSNWCYSECILMEGDTHAFCVIFFATQSMASKPPAVTLGFSKDVCRL